MKRCDNCKWMNPDSAAECINCGKSNFDNEAVAAGSYSLDPAVPVPSATKVDLAGFRGVGFVVPPSPGTVKPADPESASLTASTILPPPPPPLTPPPASAANPTPPPPLTPPAPSTGATASGATTTAGTTAPPTPRDFLLEIKQEFESHHKPRILVFFGYSNTGKSWFILRTKEQATGHELGMAKVMPPIYRIDAPGGAAPSVKGRELPTTRGIEVHSLVGSTGSDAWALVDIEGEAFQTAANDQFAKLNVGFLSALAYADALAFVFPASEALAADEAKAEQNITIKADEAKARIEGLMNSINQINALMHYFEEQRAAKVSPEDAVTAFSGKTDAERAVILAGTTSPGAPPRARSRKPVMVLLSKADRYGQLKAKPKGESKAASDWERLYDADPYGALARGKGPIKGLLRQINNTFENFHVDFVTAFAGHEELLEVAPSYQALWVDRFARLDADLAQQGALKTGGDNKLVVEMDQGKTVLKRVFDCRREQLWEAFESGAFLKSWWDPTAQVVEVRECKFRDGGSWRVDCVAKDGMSAIGFSGAFSGVKEPDTFTWTFAQDGDARPVIETYRLIELGSRVRLEVSSETKQNFTYNFDDCPAYGVVDAMVWLKKAIDSNRKQKKRRIASKAVAMWLRKRVDEDYRKALKTNTKT